MPKKITDPRARAVSLLARREHSARELKRKLAAKGLSDDEAAAAVEHAVEQGYQSDTRYAEMLVRTRINGGYGPRRIEAELQVAGVSAEHIRAAMDAAGADWRELAAQAHARKFGAPPRSSAERAKQFRYLQGRGFEAAQIGAVLKGEIDD